MPIFEISTTKYEEDIKLIQVAMTKMEAICNVASGFKFEEPTSRFGWTFLQIYLDQELCMGIEDKLSDMIKKCKGHKPDEKFTNFLSQYFESRDCNVKVKMVND